MSLDMSNYRLSGIEGPTRLASAELELKLLERLVSVGLAPGRDVSVISKGGLGVLIEVDNSTIFVSRKIANLLSCEVSDYGR